MTISKTDAHCIELTLKNLNAQFTWKKLQSNKYTFVSFSTFLSIPLFSAVISRNKGL